MFLYYFCICFVTVFCNCFCNSMQALFRNESLFCKKTPLLFLSGTIKLDGIKSKIKWKLKCLFYFVSQTLRTLLIKDYIIQLGFRWVLRRRLEARGKSQRLSKRRKTYQITVHFLSNKMQPRSALQIALLHFCSWS